VEIGTCQYCGIDLDQQPPVEETGWLYGVECSRCPPERRRSQVLARRERVAALECPDCGATLEPAEQHPDVLVVKEMTYEVCAACGARRGVARVHKVRDVSGGTM
jgi:translation initiation factor 2 beta subunit (eIF-2beta)/eIF-5